jgi:ATP-dependent DNA helicase PIF1
MNTTATATLQPVASTHSNNAYYNNNNNNNSTFAMNSSFYSKTNTSNTRSNSGQKRKYFANADSSKQQYNKQSTAQKANKTSTEFTEGSLTAEELSSPSRMHNGAIHVPASFFKLSLKQQLVVYLTVIGRLNVAVLGAAGCGKTQAMKVVKEMFHLNFPNHGKLQFAATAGLPATHLPQGITLHSYLGLGLAEGDPLDLVERASKNSKLRKKFIETAMLVIDEISMAEPRLLDTLNLVARRLRNQSELPFGGLPVVVCGDFHQLPPVQKNNNNSSSFANSTSTSTGSTVSGSDYSRYRFCFELPEFMTEFVDCIVHLTEVFRQRDPKFIALLDRVARGQLLEEDHQLFEQKVRESKQKAALRALQSSSANAVQRENALLPGNMQSQNNVSNSNSNSNNNKIVTELQPFKNSVKTINDRALDQLERSKELPQKRRTYPFRTHGTKAQGMHSPVFDQWLETMKKDCLASVNVEVCLGSQVILVCNLDPENGLVNGKQGVVVGFHPVEGVPIVKFNNGITEIIRYHIWKCEDEEVASQVREDARRAPSWNKSKFSNNGNNNKDKLIPHITYEQIPLALADALTMHKSQGMTLEYSSISLQGCFEPGMAYVALGRSVSLENTEITSYSRTCIRADPRVVAFYDQVVKPHCAPLEERLQQFQQRYTKPVAPTTSANCTQEEGKQQQSSGVTNDNENDNINNNDNKNDTNVAADDVRHPYNEALLSMFDQLVKDLLEQKRERFGRRRGTLYFK